jgi:hypothetical protein
MTNPIKWQAATVAATGVAALLTGSFANYRNYGLRVATLYVGLLACAVYLFLYQIRCVVVGSCYSTSWWTAAAAAATFSTLAWYYYTALQKGEQIVTLQAQPVVGAFAGVPEPIKRLVSGILF